MWKGDTNNPAPNSVQEGSNVSAINISENRSHNVRRDQDTDKNFTVKLIDIDTAIFEYIDKYINISVLDNGTSIKVPIFYASPEKWKSIQKDGGLRDGQGKLQLPVMVFKRNSVAKNQQLLTVNRHLTYPIIKRFTEKNKYDNFSVLSNSFAPNHQITSVTLPDHVTITYEFLIQSEYVEQMNTIIQKINFAAEEYWGDPKRFRFRVYIEDYSLTTENEGEKDRVVKSNFTATVQAYLLEESLEQRKLTTQRHLTPRKIVINTETVANSTTMNVINRVFSEKNKKPYPYSWDGVAVQKDGDTFRIPEPTMTEGNADGQNVLNGADITSIQNIYQNLQTIINTYSPGIWHNPPASPTSGGEEGWIAYDSTFFYVYVNNRWLRQPISNWQVP
jgi:hypothetical protein